MQTLRPVLLVHPFFQGLKKQHLDVLVGCASNVRFEKGSFIFRAGEEADCFYLLREGRVELDVPCPGGEPIKILDLAAGEVLGWSWLVPPYRWKFDARTKEPTRAVRLSGRCLREKLKTEHDLGFELLSRFADLSSQRVEAANRALLSVRAPEIGG
jgi:CRP-like cAMP-binding protein